MGLTTDAGFLPEVQLMDCDLITRRNAVATAAPLPMVMLEWSGLSIGAWLSLVEHLVRDQGVGGSNPLAPIYIYRDSEAFQITICNEICNKSRDCLEGET